MNLSAPQKKAIATLRHYPNEMIMHDGYLTGGHGVRINTVIIAALERREIIINKKR